MEFCNLDEKMCQEIIILTRQPYVQESASTLMWVFLWHCYSGKSKNSINTGSLQCKKKKTLAKCFSFLNITASCPTCFLQIQSLFTLWGKYTSWGKMSKRLLFNWAVHIILDEPTQRSEQIQRSTFEGEKTEIIQETHVFSCHCMTVRRTSQRK